MNKQDEKDINDIFNPPIGSPRGEAGEASNKEDKMDSWLPKDYKVPTGSTGYMKFQTGENIFRILSAPVIGWEWWTKDIIDGKESKTPHRVITRDEVPIVAWDDTKNLPIHFWAFIVFNYHYEKKDEKWIGKIQILEVKQKMVMNGITALTKSTGWGSPLLYDISVTKTGEMKESKYSVIPIPPKPVEDEILEKYEDTPIDLQKLFTGEDPYGKK